MAKEKTQMLHRKGGLYLQDAGHKGRGVFCTTGIKAGEVLEVSPALILDETDTDQIEDTILCNYVFEVGDIPPAVRKRYGIAKTGACSAAIMGVASFCNHDEHPNATIEWEEIDGTLYYSLRATRAIPKGKEICTSYGDGWFDDRK